MATSNPRAMTEMSSRDVTTGLLLAALIIAAWLSLHISAIFFIDWSVPGRLIWAVPVVLLQTWLSVGLFIVAHDAMHGTLVPANKGLNDAIGRFCVAIYAGFSYSRLYESHHDHHRYAGTDKDPDFDPDHPTRFWPWYFKFFRTYFGWREFAALTVIVVVYMLILWGRWPNILLFWALPAILSSFQLFYFGTFRPHRLDDQPFTDRHNARSNEFSWLLSLLTCFHFGYHHEHHASPFVPWWKLPGLRGTTKTGGINAT